MPQELPETWAAVRNQNTLVWDWREFHWEHVRRVGRHCTWWDTGVVDDGDADDWASSWNSIPDGGDVAVDNGGTEEERDVLASGEDHTSLHTSSIVASLSYLDDG